MAELIAGLSIGLAAGITPGPLQALVVTSTLRRGFGAGWRVALGPLVTDAPIVALALLTVSRLPEEWVRGLGIVGGVVVIAFGVWELRNARGPLPPDGEEIGDTGDLARGALVNIVNPHPWVFWVIAGAPAILQAWDVAPWRSAAFVAGFYVTLIGSKIVLAWVVAAGRHRLSSSWRRRLLVAGGILLILGGTLLVVGGLEAA